MKLQIRQFACLMNVSVRTLQYYDEIGLLCPAGMDAQNGYRYYDEHSIERMRTILFYRALGFPLKRIPELLKLTQEGRRRTIERQKQQLLEQKQRLEEAIERIEAMESGERHMRATDYETKTEGKGANLTALMSAFARAYHCRTAAKPVFADTKAAELMTTEEYSQISAYILGGLDFFAPDKKGSFLNAEETLRYLVNTQLAPTPIARARYCEDSLKTAVRTGTAQYVILGAGMDSFAFRNPEFMSKHAVFEVDHPDTQRDKLERIHRAGWTLSEQLHFVSVDFTVDDLFKKLCAAGFDPRKKTFFSWLGVSFYLDEEAIVRTLEAIRRLSAEGSTLLFDFADEELFSSPVRRVQNMLAMAAAGGEPIKACFNEEKLVRLLERCGFLVYELLAPGEIQMRYFDGCGEELSAFEHICYALAVAK